MSSEAIEVYKKTLHKYEEFTSKCEDLLITLFQESELNYQLVESRTKTLLSFEDKINRKTYINPIAEITDMCGLRIIVYYIEDIEEVKKLIRTNFVIDEENSMDKSTELEPNQFGYLSHHFVVGLSENRISLPEWRTYSNFKAEIQVRTIMQHSWASIFHELHYKKPKEFSKKLDRKLFRLAALIELADEELLNIKEKYNLE